MDELIQRRYVRRLALLAALTCSGPSLHADQPQNATSTFRNLIAQGWDKDGSYGQSKQTIDLPVARGLERPPILANAHARGVAPLAELIRNETESAVDQHSNAIAESNAPTAIETIAEETIPAPAVGSPVANAQVVRLRESARQSLRKSRQRLQRRATHSAKMYAKESLRAVVAMRDVEQGETVHAKELNLALDAIRESRDFGTRFGVIDTKTLARMVAVHKTRVLKDRNLEHVSAIDATESYLAHARINLVRATGGSREASDALTILGSVERETASPDNSHALAVAMTMQQAAVDVAPMNMLAHRELGITLSRQGLVDLAAESLMQSLAIQPTRIAYERLLEISRRTGDVDTAQSCVAALGSGHLPSEISVRTISPERFATTHRPSSSSIQRKQANSVAGNSQQNNQQNSKLKKADAEPVRVSLRSILPFGRK